MEVVKLYPLALIVLKASQLAFVKVAQKMCDAIPC